MYRILAASAVLLSFALGVIAAPVKDEPKPKGPLVLKLVAKKETYVLDTQGMKPEEWKKHLEKSAQDQKDGKRPDPAARGPKSIVVDFVLEITNTTKEEKTILVDGDANEWTFELSGPGVVVLVPNIMMTMDFKMSKKVVLAPGKTHEIPVKFLSDGRRGVSRQLFWSEKGEYQLTPTYHVGLPDNDKGEDLHGEPVKITVTEK